MSCLGGEKFYQPLKDFMNDKTQEELQKYLMEFTADLKLVYCLGYFFTINMGMIFITGTFTTLIKEHY